MLSKHKTDTKIQFIDASGEEFYKKETNNNVLSQEHIDAIMQPEHYIGLAPLFAERIKQQKDAYFSALKHDK